MRQDESVSTEIEGLIATLERMSNLSTSILKAGMDVNEIATREGVDRLRQEKSLLLQKNRLIGATLEQLSATKKAHIQALVNSINKSEDFISAWCTRYRGIVDHKMMMESLKGCHDLIDDIIPQAWDWKSDILIFPSWVTPELVKAAYARGQKRICIFELDSSARMTEHPNPFYIASEEAAFEYFAQSDIYSAARVAYISVSAPSGLQTEQSLQQANKLLEDFKMAYVHRIASINTVKLQGERFLKQGLRNLPAIAEAIPFSKMIGRFEGCPMLIVSPGPSLDKNINQIKNFKGRALIVAPAQSAFALTSAGVIPDVVMIADPSEMHYLLDGVPMDQVTALVLGVTCHPKLYDEYEGKIITFNANLGLDTWISEIFRDTTKLPAGGSVSTDALCMGVFLKCSPIILVGQDLSFAGDQQYASQAADGQVKIIKNIQTNTVSYSNLTNGLETVFAAGGFDSSALVEPLRTLPGYYGGTVFTKTDYAIFHTEFQNIAKAVNNEGDRIKLLNCTEGGAYIAGFTHISLHEAHNMLISYGKSFDFSGILREILNSKDSLNRRDQLARSLKIMWANLRAVGDSATKCLQLSQIATRSGQIGGLEVEEKRLIALVQQTLFISLAAQEKIMHAMQLGAEAQSLSESLAASNILFRLVKQAANELVPIVDQTLDRLSIRSTG